MIGAEDLREITEFLFEEAELLDSGRFAEWLKLLTDDVRYRIVSPIIAMAGPATDASHAGALLFDEDIRTLRSRVRQLITPEHTVAENPKSVDRRFVANVRASYDTASESFDVRSNILLRRARGVGTEPDIVSASRRDTLRRVGGVLHLSARSAQLDDPVVQARNLSFFL